MAWNRRFEPKWNFYHKNHKGICIFTFTFLSCKRTLEIHCWWLLLKYKILLLIKLVSIFRKMPYHQLAWKVFSWPFLYLASIVNFWLLSFFILIQGWEKCRKIWDPRVWKEALVIKKFRGPEFEILKIRTIFIAIALIFFHNFRVFRGNKYS